jgi:hypothetical protein
MAKIQGTMTSIGFLPPPNSKKQLDLFGKVYWDPG